MAQATPYNRESTWRAELIRLRDNKSYGRFNHDDVAFGSETGSVDDPEYGSEAIGGKQTAGSITIDRPFRRSRDRAAYQELKPQRGREKFLVVIHDLDDDGQPVLSAPMDTLICMLTEVTLPGGKKGGSDPSSLKIELEVNP
jgi:hypothetical protein